MKVSAISWTDYSGGDLNFVMGCTPVSEGCRNCYAKAIYDRFGKDFSKVMIYEDKLKRLATFHVPFFSPKRGAPHNPMCFVCDTGDLFHPDVPAEFITLAFEIMAARKDVTWQVLTKRPERMREVLFGQEGNWYLGGGDYIPNIWLGVSAENQARADERIPILFDCWQGICWVSGEPLLEAIRLPPGSGRALDWVVVGAESGPSRRPFDADWAEYLYEQCQAAAIPMFAKQGSGLRPGTPLLIHGREVKQWPDERHMTEGTG